MAQISKVAKYIKDHPGRSAWSQGVTKYALEILSELKDRGYKEVPSEKTALNGAVNWKQYSEGGCSLIYDEDIAKRLCTKSELVKLRRKDGWLRNPNSRENWIQCQARALFQAWNRIVEANRMV